MQGKGKDWVNRMEDLIRQEKLYYHALPPTSSGRRGRLIESLGYILADLGRGTGPRGEKMAGRSPVTHSQDLATILDPFRVIFLDLGPDRLPAT